MQQLKEEVLRIDQELKRLEERLVYPAGGQLAVFLSVAPAEEFRLDSVDVQLDGKKLTSHVYGYRELEALLDGGVQRLHVANVRPGSHRIGVTIRGAAGNDREYEVSDNFDFRKTQDPRLLELRVVETDGRQPGLELVSRP